MQLVPKSKLDGSGSSRTKRSNKKNFIEIDGDADLLEEGEDVRGFQEAVNYHDHNILPQFLTPVQRIS